MNKDTIKTFFSFPPSAMGSLGDDTVPYIVGGACAAVIVVALAWYAFAKIRLQKTLKKMKQVY